MQKKKKAEKKIYKNLKTGVKCGGLQRDLPQLIQTPFKKSLFQFY